MDFIATIALVINVIAALSVVILVLVQHGKGADMGAAFGSGSAGGLFGSAGSANFLSRSTAVAATVFFASCLALVMLTSTKTNPNDLGVMTDLKLTASGPLQASGPNQKAASMPQEQNIPD